MKREGRTVTEKSMKLVLGEEGEPTDSIALVLAQLDLDRDRYLVLLDLVAVEELGEELALGLSFCEEVGREARWIGEASLERAIVSNEVK